MPNLVARHQFRDLPGLLRRANRANDAPALARLLREQNKRHPDANMIRFIVYDFKLFKSDLAESMLDAFSKALKDNGTISAPLSLSQNMLEFDSYLPDLGCFLNNRETSELHPENDPWEQLAAAVGIPTDVLREMSRGTNRLVPQEITLRVAQAAQGVLRLPGPLNIVRLPAKDRSLKPLGAETNKEPHKCKASIGLRADIIRWFRQGGADRIAAQ